MTITVKNSSKIFDNIQTLVLYQNGSGYLYPLDSGILAPSTDLTRPTYSAGRLLAQYTTVPPTPALQDAYVNYDPASSNADQAKCVAIIPTGYYNLTGLNNTSTSTATDTINNINVARLLAGVQLFYATIVAQNSTAVVTGFNTSIAPVFVTQVWLDGVQSNIVAIK
jgi:hypothetical protein